MTTLMQFMQAFFVFGKVLRNIGATAYNTCYPKRSIYKSSEPFASPPTTAAKKKVGAKFIIHKLS
jgi:hypothetical protein